MRLTRHARNRLRWIGRRHRAIAEDRLLDALPSGETAGYDERGNRRVRISLGEVELIVVIDDAQQIVITVWVV